MLRPMTHYGDPCIHCGTPHDEVSIGPCTGDPKKAVAIANCTVLYRVHGYGEHRWRMSDGRVVGSAFTPWTDTDHKYSLTDNPQVPFIDLYEASNA